MPGPKADPIELSEAAEQELRRLASAHTTGQQLAKRCQIILLASSGQSSSAIARKLEVRRWTVQQWRARWLQWEPIPLDEMNVAERLDDLPRSGKPARITAEQRCQLEAIACQPPETYGRPISQWTGRELADELVKQGIVEGLSPRHAGRLLKRSLHSAAQEPLLAEYDEG